MAARAEFEARINGPFGAGSLLQPDLQSRGGPVGGPAVGRRPGKLGNGLIHTNRSLSKVPYIHIYTLFTAWIQPGPPGSI